MTGRQTKDPGVVDAIDRARYELTIAGELVAYLDYSPVRSGAARLLLTHTEVQPDFGGLGIGTRLVRAALDDIRARGGIVEPRCDFAAAVIAKHPQYADLVFRHESDPLLEGQQRN